MLTQPHDETFALLQPGDDAQQGDEDATPVVVLMGWVGAQRDGALLKYAQLLAGHGYTTVRCVQPTAVAFSPLEGSRRRWALGLLRFLESAALWPQRRLVLYSFSNGGAFVVEQLQLLAERDERYAQLPGTVAGFIFDSAPVYPHPGAKQRVLAASEPPGLRRTLLSAFLRAADAVESVAGRRGDHRAGAFWANMQRLSWARPLMYLYSADDPLADGAAITALVEDKRRRGHDVRARCWERSAHVAHLRHHREEYTRLLLGFLQDVRLPGGGGGGGGTHVRAAAAIAAPPRSRL